MHMLSAPDPCCLQVSSSSSRISSASMERISQWVASQEIPSDLTVRIGDSVFPLHKAVMVPKCGYIRRAVAAVSSKDDPSAPAELYLSAIPGGADAFEQAALYCYGGANNNLEITARNAAVLLCAATFLDMDGLARRAEEFMAQAGLRTLPNAVAVLRSCERLLPAAEELGVVRRAADAVALKICNEALFRPPGWWTAELVSLSPASFGRVVTALRCRRAGAEVIATAAAAYAELTLAEVLLAGNASKDDDAALLLESVVDVLPPGSDAPLPAALLCRLLHAAVNSTNVSSKTCRDLELRVAAVLDQATADDLLGVALDGAGERVTNADTVRRVITAFVERQQQQKEQRSRRRRASLSSGRGEAEVGSMEEGKSKMEKVARTVDEAAAEMATEEALPISKFVGLLGAVPRDARQWHDWVYRAVDVYLKTHPGLDEIEREKVCGVMDPLRLSYQARLHASQNKRLPLQAVLTALYYDNLNLRSSDPALTLDGLSARADASQLVRENEALRSELAQIRAYLSTNHSTSSSSSSSKGSGSSVPAAKKKKKATSTSFFLLGSAVTRTLSRLNPFNFKGAWVAKDTSSSMADGHHQGGNTIRDQVLKPKRRRFSIS